MLSFNHLIAAMEIYFLSVTCAEALQIMLSNLGSSYTATLDVGNYISELFVIDTTSGDITVNLNNNISASEENECSKHVHDQSTIMVYSTNCTMQIADIGFGGGGNITSNIIEADRFVYQDSSLHQWNNSTGIFGIGYTKCQGTSCFNLTSPFHDLLRNIYDTTVFGLDLNNNTSPSFIDIGTINDTYSSSFEWAPRQMASFPQNYDFMINDLTFCDVHVMSNMSTSWPSRIDTASACLTLPAEVYNNVVSWLDMTVELPTGGSLGENVTMSNEDVMRLVDLPDLYFTLNQDGQSMRISLKDLLIDSSELVNHPDAPVVMLRSERGVKASNLQMCLLPSSYVRSSSPAYILLGSLALRSLYAGIDVDSSNPRIGFANKRPERAEEKARQCAAAVTCSGSQYTSRHSNSCRNPDCRKYFYATLNEVTHQCEYDQGSIVVGILLVVIFATWEVTAFFVSQYTSYMLIPENSRKFSVDWVTLSLGRVLTVLVDKLIVDVLCWMPDDYAATTTAGHALLVAQEDELESNGVTADGQDSDVIPFLSFDGAHRQFLLHESD